MGKVLLIEDQEADANRASTLLAALGVRDLEIIREAPTAIMMLEKALAGHRDLPRAIILDLNLPSSSGFEVLRFYHGSPKLKKIPILVWSILDTETERNMSMWLGAKDFISKSAGEASLLKALGNLLPVQQQRKQR